MAGYKCPKCGNTKRFVVEENYSVRVEFDEEGEYTNVDMGDWDAPRYRPQAWMMCDSIEQLEDGDYCEYDGTMDEFVNE